MFFWESWNLMKRHQGNASILRSPRSLFRSIWRSNGSRKFCTNSPWMEVMIRACIWECHLLLTEGERLWGSVVTISFYFQNCNKLLVPAVFTKGGRFNSTWLCGGWMWSQGYLYKETMISSWQYLLVQMGMMIRWIIWHHTPHNRFTVKSAYLLGTQLMQNGQQAGPSWVGKSTWDLL